MIACRPLLRVDIIWNNATRIASSVSSPLFHSQSCCVRTTFGVLEMGGAKDSLILTDRQKKRKTVIPIWRPIHTQSECFVKGLGTSSRYSNEAVDTTEGSDVGCQLFEVQNSSSSCISDIPDESIAGTTVALTSSFSAKDYGNQLDGTQEKQSVLYSCGKEDLHERSSCMSVSESDVAHYQDEVVKGSTLDFSSNKEAESASDINKVSVSVEVGSSLMRFVKGKGGSTQHQIEAAEGVKIIFPTSKDDNYIVIEGMSSKNVTKASEKVASILEEAVKSPSLDYSHFISLPLAIHPELVEKLQNFQNSIMGFVTSTNGNLNSDPDENTSNDNDVDKKLSETPNIAVKLEVEDEMERVRVKINSTDAKELGIDRSIFIKPKTFHLTVLMLKLWNKDRVAAATEVLQKISSKVRDALDNRPVSVRLKGLDCMRGSRAKARVLYAPVEEIGGEGRLLRACQVIMEAYAEAGLVLEKDAQQTLKLHATLMNVRHRKRKKKTRNDSFDARNIFKRYEFEEWGDYLVREVHLSQRFTFDETGYYHCCASMPFPETTAGGCVHLHS